MAIFKGFDLQAVDANGNVIGVMGRCLFPALRWTADLSSTYFTIANNTVDVFAPYTPDYDAIGNAISDNYDSETISKYAVLAPLILRRESIQYAGYYAKLAGNTSGYYAISAQPITSQGFVTGTWYLYDNQDRLLGSADAVACGFPLSDSVGFRLIMPHDIQQDLITGPTYSLMTWTIDNPRLRIFVNIASRGNMSQIFISWFNNLAQVVEPDEDPYAEIGISGPGGGDGTFDFSSTPIDFQGVPTIGAYQTGMIDLYVPSASQLAALSNYLWAGAFDVDNFKKLLADPMDAILGLSIVPVSAAEIGVGAGTLAVGNISTGLSMPIASRQYVPVDCGSIDILPKYGAYLDFAPYCKLQLFLPYIGYVQISPDDCMNGSISVRYTVDILSGMCVAQVKCNDHVLYELAGSCSCQCPVTAGQYQNIALAALRVVGAGAVTGAAIASGNAGGVAAGIEEAANSIISTVKPEIERSGGFGGSSGLMGHQIPYLILTIPRMCRPGEQNKEIGYPSFVNLTLGDITGFASVAEIHLRGITGASDADLLEIESLLKEGVYL